VSVGTQLPFNDGSTRAALLSFAQANELRSLSYNPQLLSCSPGFLAFHQPKQERPAPRRLTVASHGDETPYLDDTQ
jgi:hypothetical protein